MFTQTNLERGMHVEAKIIKRKWVVSVKKCWKIESERDSFTSAQGLR